MKKEILDAAKELLLSKGYEETAVSDIMERAGVTVPYGGSLCHGPSDHRRGNVCEGRENLWESKSGGVAADGTETVYKKFYTSCFGAGELFVRQLHIASGAFCFRGI